MALEQLLSSACDQLLDCVWPVFCVAHESDRMEQVGSGVLLRISDEVFLLTAAHVADERGSGNLFLPGRGEIVPVSGHFAHILVPKGGKRADDKIDVAYFRLSEDLRTNLDPSLRVLIRDDVLLHDQLFEGDCYTFAGYPGTKSRLRHDGIATEPFTYTGGAASEGDYERLGYSPTEHIVMRFSRKGAFTLLQQGKQTAPHPRGMSGGGVFAWPKDLCKRVKVPSLKLVGIAHTYHERHHCMVATRLNAYLACIFANNPALQASSETAASQPRVTGIAWYKKEEWEELLRSAEDADKMAETWQEWRQKALEFLEGTARHGRETIPVTITVEEISAYCEAQGLRNTGRTRSELASMKVAAMMREQPVPNA